MFDFARFHILGRVGKIKTFEKSIRVSIAANASYKKDGKWVDETDWNEIVVFDKNTIKYVTENVESGDYVRVQGRLRQNCFKRDGETVYVVELICDEFSRAPKKKAAESAAA
ncbi:single-stranded DNA-binding protein [Methylocystis iwaonis]|uniref:single-stranded DNA-binding protein n=1 Tax=Methylocystis iwaonis TaxID=2885079 RepID=UPI002E7B2751|nr:single-stranded DNA-binding protein [Methylocystis iwaonis]